MSPELNRSSALPVGVDDICASTMPRELRQLRCRLDREDMRFEAIQKFSEGALRAETEAEFGQLVCDTTVDLFGCEVGLVWCLLTDQNPRSCMFQSGIDEISENDWRQMRDWVGEWLASDDSVQSLSAGRDGAMPLPTGLGLDEDFLVTRVIDPSGLLQGLLIAANPKGKAWPDEEDGKDRRDRLFQRFAKQVGTLATSFMRQRSVAAQNDKIRIAEERLSTALACSNVGLWEWDVTSNCAFYSDQWKLQLGFSPEEVGDSPDEFFDRVHSDDVANVREVSSQAATTPGSVFDYDFRMRHRDGHWRWINSRGGNISSPDGKTQRLIGTHSDITEFKRMERKLRDAEEVQRLGRERAERQNQAKSSFLASVSHEIRTPLNGVMGALQLLRRTEGYQQRKELLDMGESAGSWMLKIIDESLDYAALDSGEVQLNPEVADLKWLLEDLKMTKRQLVKGHNIDFKWSVSSDVPRWVCMDSVRLRQILSNLISNACKFTPQGSVEFEASVRKTQKNGNRLIRFAVRDSGVGLSKEFTQILFEPFTQEKARSETPERGIGLGLVIAKELIELMGGKIKVLSKLGNGSEFVVDIPFEECSEPAGPAPVAPPVAMPIFKGRILLAEDDESSGALAKLMMERLGLDVDLVVDGGQALDHASSGRYDLIFMDCWMPVVSGIEVVRRLRSSPEMVSSAAPIVALTANSRPSDVAECRDAGMNDFMTKPLIFNDLIAMLQKFLSPKAADESPK
ncbi:MAG: ATP-binding protein [Luteolibacter sp.]